MMRRSVSRVLAGLVAAAALSAVSSPALACGMYEPKIEKSSSDRIAKAERLLEKGKYDEAARHARSVAFDEQESDELRSKAFGIAAVARWKQGKKNAAAVNFRRARALDASSYETLLARQSDEKAIREVVDEA